MQKVLYVCLFPFLANQRSKLHKGLYASWLYGASCTSSFVDDVIILQSSKRVLQHSVKYAGEVRHSLTRTTLLTLVLTKVDYYSSVLSGISGQLLQRLQSVFNAAARLVFSARKSEHITPLLRELHWLKVPERIQFRLCVLAYRCLICTAPSYLAETLHLTADVGSRRRLRNASTSTLVIPSI